MKRGMLALLTFGLIGITSHSLGVSLGLQGGASLAQFKTVPEIALPITNRTGAAAGVFFDFALANWLSIGPEVLYVQKGGKASVTGIDLNYQFDYVEVPLLLKIRLGGQSVGLTLFGGAAYGSLLSAKVTVLTTTTDLSSQLTKNDLSAHVGTAIGLMMGKGMEFFLSARYILGIQDIDSDGDPTDSTKNSAMLALAGLKFHLGKN